MGILGVARHVSRDVKAYRTSRKRLNLRLELRGAHWWMTEVWTHPSPSAILFSLVRHGALVVYRYC